MTAERRNSNYYINGDRNFAPPEIRAINYELIMWNNNDANGIRPIVQLCGKLTNNSWHLRIVRENQIVDPKSLAYAFIKNRFQLAIQIRLEIPKGGKL